MICRTCYLSSLTPDERDRANAEPVTGSVFLCMEHQTLMEHFERAVDWSIFLRANRQRIHDEAEWTVHELAQPGWLCPAPLGDGDACLEPLPCATHQVDTEILGSALYGHSYLKVRREPVDPTP